MKVIKFSYSKLFAEKLRKMNKVTIETNIDFLKVEEEKADFSKEEELLNISFVYTITYKDAEKKSEKLGEVEILGNLIVLATQEEAKEIWKAWKKKGLPVSIKVFFSNQIIRKCLPNAVRLQEEVNLPHHIPLPLLTLDKPQTA
jgi:hypothetical protein